jgi:hypothetical protein
VRRTATFAEGALLGTLLEAEDRLGRRLDEWPRPHLCDGGMNGFGPQAPGAQHLAFWFAAPDLFERRKAILAAVDARLALDPYATLDVVLCPETPFPIDLLEAIRARLAGGPQSYFSRALAHRGEDLQRRIAVVLRGGFAPDWVEAIRGHAQVFRDRTAGEALRDAEDIGAGLPGARITGDLSDQDFAELARRADGDAIAFADPRREADWTRRVLGFGDAR